MLANIVHDIGETFCQAADTGAGQDHSEASIRIQKSESDIILETDLIALGRLDYKKRILFNTCFQQSEAINLACVDRT